MNPYIDLITGLGPYTRCYEFIVTGLSFRSKDGYSLRPHTVKFKINENEALQLDITMQVGIMGGAAFLPKGLEDGKGNGSQLSSYV